MVEILAERLRILRAMHKVQSKTVAAAVGAHASAYSAWERAERPVPDHMIPRIADYYNVTTDYLFGIEDRYTIVADGLLEHQILAVESQIAAFKEDNRLLADKSKKK